MPLFERVRISTRKSLFLSSRHNWKQAEKILSLYESSPCKGEGAACLDFSVHVKDIWNAAKYGLDLFLCKDWSPKLSFLLQWNFK